MIVTFSGIHGNHSSYLILNIFLKSIPVSLLYPLDSLYILVPPALLPETKDSLYLMMADLVEFIGLGFEDGWIYVWWLFFFLSMQN